ncbi:MAG: hypothetical protein L3J16_02440 [Anaerolineales bacterium]|nr:hypothetical protein [Anaerolineales bacterium]
MKKGNLTGGLILILIGMWFLAVQFVPALKDWADGSWPLSIIGLGIIFLLVSILNNKPGFSIPAFILGGIGGLLYYQNVTGDWGSWAYAWSLIPGFVGLGLLFFSLQTRERGTFKAGLILLFLSMVFFAVFGSFLGGPTDVIRYWPVLLIFAGLWSMVRSLFSRGKPAETAAPATNIEDKQE